MKLFNSWEVEKLAMYIFLSQIIQVCLVDLIPIQIEQAINASIFQFWQIWG